MGSDASGESGAFVGRLAQQARRLQREARAAIARGDYGRAEALIDDAELLAGDVHGLVDDFEHREADRMMGHAAAEAQARRRRMRLPSAPRRRGIMVAIGAGFAMSLVLAEC